jgi:hypothetical protein
MPIPNTGLGPLGAYYDLRLFCVNDVFGVWSSQAWSY